MEIPEDKRAGEIMSTGFNPRKIIFGMITVEASAGKGQDYHFQPQGMSSDETQNPQRSRRIYQRKT
jgi:hypothetical protein